MMTELKHRTVETNGIRIYIAEAGSYEPRCSGKGWALSKLATVLECDPADLLKGSSSWPRAGLVGAGLAE
jgi:hypothetical protein